MGYYLHKYNKQNEIQKRKKSNNNNMQNVAMREG